MSFTEFCCRSGGSNLNAGTRLGDSTEPGTSAALTYASGSWVQSTRIFTVASGNPSSDGVAVGDFASVYPDAAAVAVFVGRVTALDATTITISGTAKSGTAPVDGTTNTTLKIGGAWKGPNGAEKFPFLFVTNALTNVAGAGVRVNLKNDATYSITAAITMNVGAMRIEGYTTAFGDGERAIIDGGTSGASYVLMTTADDIQLHNFILQNNGATGSATGLALAGARPQARNIVVNNVRGIGINASFGNGPIIECEAYACNQSNTANLAGIQVATGNLALRCISHDNAGSNAIGFYSTGYGFFVGCIADSNGAQGFLQPNGGSTLIGCDSYNNASDGIRSNSSFACYIENSNFVKNGGYGINATGSIYTQGFIVNCGFGSGTQANTSGTTNLLGGIVEVGSITYAANVTPWVDAANGDFRINLAASKGSGRGNFTQTAASYAGTVGYPDIGAAQHLETAGGGASPIGLGSPVIRAA